MNLIGRAWKTRGTPWTVEVSSVGLVVQAESREEAKALLAASLEAAVNRPDFKVTVTDHAATQVLLAANDPAALAAYVLKYQRWAHGMSLADAQKALGFSSMTTFRRYELGEHEPPVGRFVHLLHGVAPELALFIGDRVVTRKPSKTSTRRRPKGAQR